MKPTTLFDPGFQTSAEAQRRGRGLGGLRGARWMKDGLRLAYLDSDGEGPQTLFSYQVETGERTRLVDPAALKNREGKPVGLAGHQWSPDESALLLSDVPNGRGRSQGNLYVFTLADQKLRTLTENKLPQRNAKFSPDGKKVGLVRADDLWVIDLASGRERRLTKTANPTRYNGRFGWVYEEELDLVDGWEWSPDSRTIAYYQIDEKNVPQVNITNYDDLHLTPVETRYPKAGDPNPLVKVGFVAAERGATRWVDLGPDSDIYVARIQWMPKGEGLLIQRMPRLQNRIDLLLADPKTGQARVLLTEEDPAWVDAKGVLTLLLERGEFLWPSDRDGFNHLYLYRMDGTLVRQVTSGSWDVEGLAHVDRQHRIAYFTAARPNPLERHLCYVPLDGGEVVQITTEPGTHTASFSPASNYYLGGYSNLNRAPDLTLNRTSGHREKTLIESPAPRANRPQWEMMTLTTSDGKTLYARMLKPPGFDASKKYPVLMENYGGPGSQTVTDGFRGGATGFSAVLHEKGYILFSVDNRGTGARGRDWMKCTYQNLGEWETHDQTEGAKYLATLPYVDRNRIGMWGWSYGGYMALMCILKGADVFKAAIAVAPPTHWRFYDSIYTERYMRRPEDNPKGYIDSAPLTYADKLKGRLLLVHGTADDNVHFQNSARMAEEFQKRGLQFTAMYYPGKHHGLEGMAPHWSALFADFLLKNL